MNEWLLLLLLALGLFLFIGVADRLRISLNWPGEFTRKLVHIATGVLVFFTPYLFTSPLPLIVLSLFFILVNSLALHLETFRGMHDTSRPTLGTVFYPLSFLVLVVFFWNGYQAVLQIAMLILAIADAVAAMVGEAIPSPHRYRLSSDTKSVEGSLAMFLCSFLITAAGLRWLPHAQVFQLSGTAILGTAAVTALFATLLEGVSWNGSDNLTAPLGAAFVLHFFLTQPESALAGFVGAVLLAAAIALLSYRIGFLNSSGAAGTFLMGSLIFGVGQWRWGIPILAFFLSSSVLSKMWKHKKRDAQLIYEKTSRRDLGQVLANGGMASLAILFYYATGYPQWYIAYLGALAAVTADTWATEIGILSRKPPRKIITLQPVPPGTSGAVSAAGLWGALGGSAFLAGTGYLSGHLFFLSSPLKTLSLVTAAGFIASLFDSLLGATVQAQYRCPICHKQTERRRHCNNAATIHIEGFRWVTNDAVNAACALAGFGMAVAGYHLFLM
jgi:uncharacterized protein (TIGR00297 family)